MRMPIENLRWSMYVYIHVSVVARDTMVRVKVFFFMVKYKCFHTFVFMTLSRV